MKKSFPNMMVKTFVKTPKVRTFVRIPLYYFFYNNDIVHFRWERLAEIFINDFLHYKNATLKEKLWAYKRGFPSERIERLGLTEDNYSKYLSDFDFYKKKMYKNLRFSYWFDDKLTTWYILQPFIEYLPVHYYSIEGKRIRLLCSESFDLDNSVEGIVQLLTQKHELALKKTNYGGFGHGFNKISYITDEYKLNNQIISLSELKSYIEKLNGYLVTEFVHSNKELRKIWDLTPSVIRMYTVYDDKEGVVITGALIRFGTEKSGLITDNEGTIYCGINIEDGTLFKPMIEIGNGIKPCVIHPDTGIAIEGKIPNWKKIINKVTEISNYLNITPYLTYDLVATEKKLKILEINSHGGTRILQPFYPFYENEYHRKLFLDNY